MQTRSVFILLLFVPVALTSLAGQEGQWLTYSHDPQRSGWASDEHAFSTSNVSAMGLLWKTILPNQPIALTGLTAPLVVRGVLTFKGLKDLVIVAGSSDRVFALDAATGELVWRFDASSISDESMGFVMKEKRPGPSSWLCPYSLNATPMIDSAHERMFVVTSDGRLHTLALSDGHATIPMMQFVRPFSKMWSLNYSGKSLYTTLSQNCNDAPSGIVAVNPDAPGRPVTTFFSTSGVFGGGIWGRGGVSLDFDGFVYAQTGDGPFDPSANMFGDTVLKLSADALQLSGYFTPPNYDYLQKHDLDLGASTPVIFRWRDRVLAAGGGKEGRLYLADAASMSGSNHADAYLSPLYTNREQTFEKNGIWGLLTVWPEPQGPLWVYAPVWGELTDAAKFSITHGEVKAGTVMAFNVEPGPNGKPVLTPVWMSSEISVPDPVAVAGGVAFVLGTGENPAQVQNGDVNQLLSQRERLNTGQAVLYALDGRNGRELWSSGSTITGWTHFSGLAIGSGKVFVTTHDGTVYAFGIPKPGVQAARISDYSERVSMQSSTAPQESSGSAGAISHCGDVSIEYQKRCALCHDSTGKGVPGTHTPDFSNSNWQRSKADAELLHAVKVGTDAGMPAFGKMLTTDKIDQLIRCVVRGFERSR
jgi:cytochrome c5